MMGTKNGIGMNARGSCEPFFFQICLNWLSTELISHYIQNFIHIWLDIIMEVNGNLIYRKRFSIKILSMNLRPSMSNFCHIRLLPSANQHNAGLCGTSCLHWSDTMMVFFRLAWVSCDMPSHALYLFTSQCPAAQTYMILVYDKLYAITVRI